MRRSAVNRAVLTLAAAGVLVAGCSGEENVHGATTAESGPCAGNAALTAEGSTSQQNQMALFNQAWARACPGKNLSYSATGSTAGIEQFIAGKVDFAGSDAPLPAERAAAATTRCDGNPAWHLPLVFGQVVMAYNLDEVDDIVLNADVLARIFTGAITGWNDPAIAALNPGVELPDAKVAPVYRSDSSGTTDNLQQYLTVAAPQSWTKGAGTDFRGDAGEGAAKTAGVVQAVRMTPGAIGYVEKGFGDQSGLRFARIDTGGGAVAATDRTAAAAIDAATFTSGDGNDLRLDMNSLYGTRVAGSYPLVQASYEIVCSKGYDPDVAAALKSFLTIAAGSGQDELAQAGYLAPPERFQQRLIAAIDAIQ